jgi:hypothetical protein
MKHKLPAPCAVWAEKLAARHPQDLSMADRLALKAHIQECEACAAVQHFYTTMDERIVALPPAPPLPMRSQHAFSLHHEQEGAVAHTLLKEVSSISEHGDMKHSLSARPTQRSRFSRTMEMGVAIAVAACLILTAALLLRRSPLSSTSSLSPQRVYQQATSGHPVLSDPLTAEDTNLWDIGVHCIFTDGAYHVTSSQAHFIEYCMENASTFTNMAYQVQMTILKGDYGGLIFRVASLNQMYWIEISQHGSYTVTVSQGNMQCTNIAASSSKVIKKGLGQTNVVTVVARGSLILLYINGQYIMYIRTKATGTGEFGFLALDTAHSTDVVYRNVRVWRL